MKKNIFLVWILSTSLLFAQQATDNEQSAFPGGAAVRKMEGLDAWQIDFSYKENKAKSADVDSEEKSNAVGSDTIKTRRIVITCTSPLWHIETMRDKGLKFHQWYDGKTTFYDTPTKGVFFDIPIKDAPTAPTPDNLVSFDNGNFPNFEWVNATSFVSVQNVGQQKCLTFSKDGMTAWVDLETRFPVAWRNGDETRLFKQLPKPTVKLVMPHKIQELGAALQHNIDSLTKPNRPRG